MEEARKFLASYEVDTRYRIERGCPNMHHGARSSTYEDGEWCWLSDACTDLVVSCAGY